MLSVLLHVFLPPNRNPTHRRSMGSSQPGFSRFARSDAIGLQVLKRANQEIFMDQKRILQKIKAPNLGGEGEGCGEILVGGCFFSECSVFFG